MPTIEQKYEVEKTSSGYAIDVWGLDKGMEWYYVKKFTGKGMKPKTLGTVRAAGKGVVGGKPIWVADQNSPETCTINVQPDGRIQVACGGAVVGSIRPKTNGSHAPETNGSAPETNGSAPEVAEVHGTGSNIEDVLDLMVECWEAVNRRKEFKDLPSEDRRSLAISLFIEMKRQRYSG